MCVDIDLIRLEVTVFLWLKAFHLIGLVSWFAGLFYLPRLFVYHAEHDSGPVHEQFVIMERKLYRYIMWPAMVVTLLCGLGLAHMEMDLLMGGGWFHAKMLLVVLLVVFHLHCGHVVKTFATGHNTRPHTFYRKYNEIPTFILIAVVILVVVRPF